MRRRGWYCLAGVLALGCCIASGVLLSSKERRERTSVILYEVFLKEKERGPTSFQVTMANFLKALSLYREHVGDYHQIKDNIEKALTGDNPENFAILHPKAFFDPWGNRYELEITADDYLIVRSPGPDGIKGNKDDLFFKESIPVPR